ncbi:DUF6493 family protein [Kitasatospora sp. NPDC088391]|uniref:DUF7824 domain-containing protein n=1 Tax=Kitasatospora sp. NPDC088391 TaxID=3364074 RepID=UPI00382ACC21
MSTDGRKGVPVDEERDGIDPGAVDPGVADPGAVDPGAALEEAIRRAAFPQVASLVRELAPDRRRTQLPRLKALRRELRAGEFSRGGAWTALLVAGAVCHSAPSAAADWIGGRGFDVPHWYQPPLVLLLDEQPADWQRAVGLRLAARPADSSGWGNDTPYEIAEHLLRRSATPPPADPEFAAEWMRDRGDPRPRSGTAQLPPGADLYARLKADDWTPVLAALVFDGPTLRQLAGPWAAKDDTQRWPAVLGRLAADGTLDRAALVRRGFARLVRGGGVGEQRGYLELLRALAPTEDELADNRRALLALLDDRSTVAGYAQEALAALDTAGRLTGAELAEASEVLLARTEKKLVRAQLAWLGRAVARDGAAAGAALRALLLGLGHPDRQLQGQALKVIGRHIARYGGELLAEARAAALSLDPVHAPAAAQLLGTAAVFEPVAEEGDRLPEPPRPTPVPAPLATPAQVAEELAAALGDFVDSVAFERVIDGLVRHAWQDRDALATALAPVLRPDEWRPLGTLARAVTGAYSRGRARRALLDRAASEFRSWDLRGGMGEFLGRRLDEIAWRLAGDPVPLLLATPTRTTGAVDPATLVERTAHYEQLGLTPDPLDLAQALLRTAPDGDAATLAAAGRLDSAAGRRLAAWLRRAEPPRQHSVPVPAGAGRPGVWASEYRRYSEQPGLTEQESALLTLPGPDLARTPDPGPAAVRDLLGPSTHFHHSAAVLHGAPNARWIAVLPHHREELALRITGQLAEAADTEPVRGAPRLLPLLAEAGGPCGFAVHQALAYGIGAAAPEDRSATVDALLSLAAQRQLDAGALGREAAELLRTGAVKPNRAAAALAELADPAPRLAWTVLAALLPALLDGPDGGAAGDGAAVPRGTADLFAVAVDCARRAGVRGPIDAVTRVAARGGRTKLVTEARDLAALLAG